MSSYHLAGTIITRQCKSIGQILIQQWRLPLSVSTYICGWTTTRMFEHVLGSGYCIMANVIGNVRIYLKIRFRLTFEYGWWECIVWVKILYLYWREITTGKAQDMLAPDCFPIHHRLLGWGRVKRCLRPGYFFLRLSAAYWRPASCCWLVLGSMSIGDQSKSH